MKPSRQVLFDISTLDPQRITGVGIYTLELFKALERIKMDFELIPILKISRFKRISQLQALFPNHKIQLFKPWRFFYNKNTIYHNPDFRLSLWAPQMCRVVTIHDLLVFENKYSDTKFDHIGQQDNKKLLLQKNPDCVLVNSDFTKNEIHKYIPEYKNKIVVTPLGCDHILPQETTESELDLPPSFLLFVGTLELRKNICGIIDAYDKFRKLGGTQKLVLAGRYGFGQAEIEKSLNQAEFKHDILIFKELNKNKIQQLYKQALVFLFPSFYEGFGIPILESMRLGCPVITSSHGAMAEVAADAALLINPNDSLSFAKSILELVNSPQERSRLIEAGLKRSQQFTWDRCAKITLKTYENLFAKVTL